MKIACTPNSYISSEKDTKKEIMDFPDTHLFEVKMYYISLFYT